MGYSDIGKYFGMGELSKSCMHKHAAAGGGPLENYLKIRLFLRPFLDQNTH